MQNNYLPGGLWPVMLTPFLDNNDVDYRALDELTEFYIQFGARGLFANCLSSEMFQLTNQERLRIVSAVVNRAAKAGVSVVASGTFSKNIDASANFIKAVYDIGVQAVVIISNQMAALEEGDEVLKKNLEQIMDRTGEIPLGIYECPYPYKRLVSSELMEWIGNSGRFVYHKDTSCDPASIRQKVDALHGSTCFIYNANTATALDSLEMGVRGLSPIGANFYPELYRYLTEEFFAGGSLETLRRLNDELNVMEGIASQCYPYSAKKFLQFRNLNLGTACRIPFENMSAENLLNLTSLNRKYRSLLEEYQINNTA